MQNYKQAVGELAS